MMCSMALRCAALCALVGALSSTGCSTSTCSRDEDTVDVYSGQVSLDKTFYESSVPNEEELIYFPPNRTLVFHFGPKPTLASDPPQGLRAVPFVSVFLSFSPDADSTIAPAAGNQSLIRVRTADRVEVRNDTCSEYYVWLVATTSKTALEPIDVGSGGSGGSGGSAGEAGATP